MIETFLYSGELLFLDLQHNNINQRIEKKNQLVQFGNKKNQLYESKISATVQFGIYCRKRRKEAPEILHLREHQKTIQLWTLRASSLLLSSPLEEDFRFHPKKAELSNL